MQDLGLYETPQPYLFSIWSEPMRRFQLAAEGLGPRQPPDHLRERLKQAMHPLPIWYAPFGDEACGLGLSGPCPDAAADGHVPLLGQPERLAAADQGAEFPVCADEDLGGAGVSGRRLGAGDRRRNGAITVPVAHMAALNENTVWTWNAIGKRKGGLGAGPMRTRGDDGVPAEPPDLANCCPTRATARCRTLTR